MGRNSITKHSYVIIFSVSLLITFASPEIATSISISFSLPRIMVSGLLLGMVPLVLLSWFYNMFTLPSRLLSTYFGTRSYQCSWCNYTPVYSNLHSFVSFGVLCSCKYWAYWYDVFYCVFKFFTESAFVCYYWTNSRFGNLYGRWMSEISLATLLLRQVA